MIIIYIHLYCSSGENKVGIMEWSNINTLLNIYIIQLIAKTYMERGCQECYTSELQWRDHFLSTIHYATLVFESDLDIYNIYTAWCLLV